MGPRGDGKRGKAGRKIGGGDEFESELDSQPVLAPGAASASQAGRRAGAAGAVWLDERPGLLALGDERDTPQRPRSGVQDGGEDGGDVEASVRAATSWKEQQVGDKHRRTSSLVGIHRGSGNRQ